MKKWIFLAASCTQDAFLLKKAYHSDPPLAEYSPMIAPLPGCVAATTQAGGYDPSNNSEMAQFLKKALRIEGPQLSQKTVTIRKNARESLGMRIGGGIGSNEGDTPIYIANIHPHGCIGKSKQMKVRERILMMTILVKFSLENYYSLTLCHILIIPLTSPGLVENLI